jgi:hypothetical protein
LTFFNSLLLLVSMIFINLLNFNFFLGFCWNRHIRFGTSFSTYKPCLI